MATVIGSAKHLGDCLFMVAGYATADIIADPNRGKMVH